jgi:cytosine deaminase
MVGSYGSVHLAAVSSDYHREMNGVDMMGPNSLTIRSARLRSESGLFDIVIRDGSVADIVSAGEADPDRIEIDASDNLVTESFVNTHLHLDKVFTLQQLGDAALADYQSADMGKAMSAIETAATVKEGQDPETMLAAGRRAVSMAAYYGNTHIRALADVDSRSGIRGVEVLVALREEFVGVVDLQVVAFAQDGIVREPGTEDLLRVSMEMGADVVGGIPWIEYTEADMAEHVRIIFDIAVEQDAPVSMLLDDAGDPGLRTLEMMATEAIRRGWQGRALAHHARAMQLYPDPYFERLVALLTTADVAVVSDPHTGPLHARVRELTAAGINVSLGQDDISDAYYAFGRNNMLEVAFLGAHLLWMMSEPDQEMLYDAFTINPADAIGLADHRIAVDNVANLVVLEGQTVTEALRFHAAPRAVISHGCLVDRDAMKELARIP